MLTVAGNATNPRAAHFTGDSFHPLRLDRTTTDGNLIEFNRDGVFVGSVSVNAGTMTYGAFTGSHYGWMDRALQRGTLVVMTGENRHLHGDDKAEPIYGIAPSEVANDARCFGAYLSLLEPQGPADLSNPHQVMAVGNGDMWVVDTGRAVRPGDYLISSDVTGHAWLDDESRFPIGIIIARRGEPVDWSRVTDTVDGRKHQRISVFFESFERGSAVGVAKLVEKQQQEIEDLRSRIGALEKSKPSAAIQAGLPLAFLGVAGFLTLRRRGANEVAGKASSNDRT